jgi:hypothetical protein
LIKWKWQIGSIEKLLITFNEGLTVFKKSSHEKGHNLRLSLPEFEINELVETQAFFMSLRDSRLWLSRCCAA